MAINWTGPTGWTGPRGPSFPPAGITGLTGQDGVNGPMGPTGLRGAIGLLGWGGGTTPGPTGLPNFNISNITGTTVTLTTAGLGTTYYITNTGFNGITMPDMTGLAVGGFWVFQNNSGVVLTVTLTTGTATWNGISGISGPIPIPAGAGITLVHASGPPTPTYIVF